MAATAHGATLATIASEAGVSVSAVSKVLNGRTDVAAGTRARVARLLREHGYQVASQIGFSVVDLLIGSLYSPWAEELIRGAVEAADEADVSVIVTPVRSPAEFARWLDRAARRGTGGALCVLHLPGVQDLRRLAAARIPIVVIDPPEEPGPEVRSVGTTNWQGGVLATRHLIDLGHRRIAVIGEDRVWSGLARLAGYRAAMLDAGLVVDDSLVRHAEFSADGGREQARQLLARPDPPTAIVAGNDAQAFGVFQVLAELGLRAPEDLSVVGFDDVPVAAWATPALTTVRQPLAAMSAAAFRMLHTGLAGAAEPHHIELATTLVVRESTAPPVRCRQLGEATRSQG
ncbi:MAG TPA: substrate-binding domain-containing protein [Streptosporangiaceae bacterium]|jgi:DNA-binding LacI/PurR family transcriptional regulator